MWKHYIKSAIRSIKANRLFSLLNILGLAVGLTAGTILLLWSNKEQHFDDFHKKAENIYHLSVSLDVEGDLHSFDAVPGPLSVIAKNIPGIESTIRIHEEDDGVLSDKDGQKIFGRNKIGYVDSNFLEVFDFKRLEGRRGELLPNISSIALTKQTALKLFGTIDVIGEPVKFDHHIFTVSAILEDFPDNSTLNYDALLPIAYFGANFTAGGGNGEWKTIDQDLGNYQFQTYVLLKDSEDPNVIGHGLSAAFNKLRRAEQGVHFNLQNIQQMHLETIDGNKADLRMVRVMFLIGILILIIASINYVNLTTARSLSKYREVGVRKIIGASKKSLFTQFVFETLIIFLCSLALSVGLLSISKPIIAYFTNTLIFTRLNDGHTCALMGLVLVGTLMASSIYPALLLSSFNPIQAISGKSKASGKTNFIRKGLVIFQFGISFALLVSTLVMSKQMQFIQRRDLGYNKEHVFIVPLPGAALDHLEAITSMLNKEPAIKSIGYSSSSDVSNMTDGTGDLEWPGKPNDLNLMTGQLLVDEHFIPTMQFQFLEGHNFSGDSSDASKYIVNESAVLSMGLKAPYIGQKITFHSKPGEIIGVLKDFNYRPLNMKVAPIVLFSKWWKPANLYVRAGGANLSQAINAVKAIYTKYADKMPFNYNFLDKNMEGHYKQQYRTGMLFKIFSGVAIFLSCLGLLGLITFTVQIRIKEIGIRKILGASITSIIRLMSKEFMILVIIGSCVFAPLTYWALGKWLQEFAYKVNLDLGPFILGLAFVLCIAFLTIGYKVIWAARANPVNSLKTE